MNRLADDVEIAGTVAIVGFPNVGKSTLINRLTATRTAVVHETPGVTRDRKELLCEWSGTTFRIIDTGGVDRADTGPFGSQIAAQARQAVEEADLVLLVVDATVGVTPGDEELAEILRTSRRPVLVLANKLDDPRRDLEALEFHRLGLGDPIPISALHGHGSGDLLDEIVGRLPGHGEKPVGEEAIKVAILGRPNVGKSSLLNALVGRERVIVSDVPGTTRDSIDTVLRRDDSTFVLVDTAGLRRKRKQRQGIEYYSELRALEAAERADVALVLIDASQGVVERRSLRGRRRPQGAVRDDRRPLEVGRDRDPPRGRPPADPHPPASATAAHRRLGPLGPWPRAPARDDRVRVRALRGADSDGRAEPRAAGAARGTAAAGAPGPPPEPPVRDAGDARVRRASASSSTTAVSSRATTATGSRTSCARASRSRACPSRSTS